MVGTVDGLCAFRCTMLMNGGTLDGKRYLGPKTLAYMTSDHMGSVDRARARTTCPAPATVSASASRVRKDAGVAPPSGSVGDYNWGGAGGTYFWVDPKENMFVVFAMQSPSNRVALSPACCATWSMRRSKSRRAPRRIEGVAGSRSPDAGHARAERVRVSVIRGSHRLATVAPYDASARAMLGRPLYASYKCGATSSRMSAARH